MEERLKQRGRFITFEGIDGSGKTTQVDRLCARLQRSGLPFIRTREPGGTAIGDKIRELLLDPASEMTPAAEVYLFAASRAELVRKVILPALDTGVNVVCDRFVDASVAYQGFGFSDGGLSPQMVKAVNGLAVLNAVPDLTVILDVPAEVAEERLSAGGRDLYGGRDRLERRGRIFFERVRSGLRTIRDSEPERCLWLDGRLDAEVLEGEIWARAAQFLRQMGR